MKKTFFIIVGILFVNALFFASHTNAVYGAEAQSLTNIQLHQLILTLTNRVGTLETELKAEKARVATMQRQMTQLGGTTAVTQTYTTPVPSSSPTTVVKTGGIGVCQDGKTVYVSVTTAVDYLMKKMGTIGVCTQDRLREGALGGEVSANTYMPGNDAEFTEDEVGVPYFTDERDSEDSDQSWDEYMEVDV